MLRGSFNIMRVKSAFDFAYQQLAAPSLPEESLLGRVIRWAGRGRNGKRPQVAGPSGGRVAWQVGLPHWDRAQVTFTVQRTLFSPWSCQGEDGQGYSIRTGRMCSPALIVLISPLPPGARLGPILASRQRPVNPSALYPASAPDAPPVLLENKAGGSEAGGGKRRRNGAPTRFRPA